MANRRKLLLKIQCLLREIKCPRFLHHFGPKKYQLKHHLYALILMEAFQLSLRRVEKLLALLGVKVPTYSALCYRRKKIPSWIWNKLMQMTAGMMHKTVAIDATGFSRTNPSFHYLRRAYREGYMRGYAKLSMLYDVDKNKIIKIHVRTRPAHEIRDAAFLLRSCATECLLADKAYDAEWLHQYCFERGIKTVIPRKSNIKRGFYRRKQLKNYSDERYHQRSLIESGFSAVKRKYGSSVDGKSLPSITSELSCKAIAHNLSLS